MVCIIRPVTMQDGPVSLQEIRSASLIITGVGQQQDSSS